MLSGQRQHWPAAFVYTSSNDLSVMNRLVCRDLVEHNTLELSLEPAGDQRQAEVHQWANARGVEAQVKVNSADGVLAHCQQGQAQMGQKYI
jgi:hypothetical protein